MKKIFSGSTLKILAIFFMVVDHWGQVVLKNGIIFMRVPYLYSYTGKEINAQNLKAIMSERLQ